MQKIYVMALGVIALGACSPRIPDSAAGVGFDNSISAQQAREAQLAGQTSAGSIAPPLAVSSETLQPVQPGTTTVIDPALAQVEVLPNGATSDDIAAEAAAALAAADANSGVAPLQASPSNPAPLQVSNNAISDENDFNAVSSRESIESDAARLQRNKEQYQTVAPTAVPTRSGSSQPNIVQYALSTSNPVGARVYSRTGINLASKAQRNCATFPSSDQAQIAFLEAGGPQRDRRNLDPDGDGYACGWNPAPYRSLVNN